MTTYECFQGAARIETLAQELYAGLAESFGGRPYLRQLFAQLSEEEGQHARRVQLLSRHQGKAPWAVEAMGRIAESLEGMAAEVESMKADFIQPGKVAEPGEVLRRVVELERRYGSIHAEQLARSGDPEVAKLFSALAAQDGRHRALIEGAGTREGQPGWAGG
jgi:rubrerythrin